ncbi:MerR family transcriptional regulator [Gemmata sp.]|uniref:helix-turn-helix domain-containing protein n=1 Tax=Gemmata sp. TaxID=1914242 RepID=UPI003F704CFF
MSYTVGMKSHAKRWTIAELGAAVERALAIDYDGARNGQVRDVPDARTIRYYASLGLVDPPAEMRGRTALYSRRHLLQVVAVKRLQASGKSLVEVQQQLVGLADAALEPIARLPAVIEQPAAKESAEAVAAPRPAPVAFWATPPAPVPAPSGARTLQLVRLSDTVSLVVEAAEPISAEHAAALRAAAGPLLRMIHAQPQPPDQEST